MQFLHFFCRFDKNLQHLCDKIFSFSRLYVLDYTTYYLICKGSIKNFSPVFKKIFFKIKDRQCKNRITAKLQISWTHFVTLKIFSGEKIYTDNRLCENKFKAVAKGELFLNEFTGSQVRQNAKTEIRQD